MADKTSDKTGYRQVLKDDQDLAIFLRAMAKFDKAFTAAMVAGVDFTLRLEIHGNAGSLVHARVYDDEFERPGGGPAPSGRRPGGVKGD